jgi:hypothetical protein
VTDGSGVGQRRTAELVDVRRAAGSGHGGKVGISSAMSYGL